MTTSCELCTQLGGEILLRTDELRVVLADEPDHPGFCRVIWNAHRSEMTDLPDAERQRLLEMVCCVEAALREVLAPKKINLASLGNVVPHLHWHVIPRFEDDPHYPRPVWAAPLRPSARAALSQAHREALRAKLRQKLR